MQNNPISHNDIYDLSLIRTSITVHNISSHAYQEPFCRTDVHPRAHTDFHPPGTKAKEIQAMMGTWPKRPTRPTHFRPTQTSHKIKVQKLSISTATISALIDISSLDGSSNIHLGIWLIFDLITDVLHSLRDGTSTQDFQATGWTVSEPRLWLQPLLYLFQSLLSLYGSNM